MKHASWILLSLPIGISLLILACSSPFLPSNPERETTQAIQARSDFLWEMRLTKPLEELNGLVCVIKPLNKTKTKAGLTCFVADNGPGGPVSWSDSLNFLAQHCSQLHALGFEIITDPATGGTFGCPSEPDCKCLSD